MLVQDFEKIFQDTIDKEIKIEPKDWMPDVPLLSCDVNGYANDYATIKGYEKMTEGLTSKLDVMTNELSRDLENLADKSEGEFVKTMANET